MKRHMISLRLKLAFVIIPVLVVGAFALNFVTPNSLIWSAFQPDSVRITSVGSFVTPNTTQWYD